MDMNELLEFADSEHSRLIKHYSGVSDRSRMKYTIFAKLIEEIGEFSQAMLVNDSMQRGDKLRNSKADIDHELADIILVCFILGKELNIDVEKALKDKIEKIKKRKYE